MATTTPPVTGTPVITLPEGWSWLLPAPPRAERGATTMDRQVRAGLDALSQASAPMLAGAGIVAAATFMLPNLDAHQVAEASLMVAYARIPPLDDPLTVLATAAPQRCERAVSPFPSQLGNGMRSLWVWHADALADADGRHPLMLTVRYVLPFTPRLAVLLQFRTMSVLYAGELTHLFDSIAASVSLSTST